ncbi:bridge-like lipid transfer protein family member 3B isoform X2 [Phymastichus coffea]|uniref:bridge-like lipid transfer protein family member 3B isoform X2 n=1 Tax=Phymastichus coffea TaxID=108790 RepID=UPI00273CCE13|nr:bridge-like lipid transfer protein family member 3B isoform X2 [Phymastichus coffea]
MVSIIKNQLLKHLSRFTKNLSADKINLSTFKGEGELTNLELDETVLTDLLELPSWLRLTSAWCNKVSFRIQWTKLKNVPIFLSLDEVRIEVETCEDLRDISNPQGLSSYTGPTKYSYIHKIIDGITVAVNTVLVTFKSPAFIAKVQMSRIMVESKSPTWQRCDLRTTRVKDPDRGQLLIFKELEWQTVRIEAQSTKDKDLTPLRLLTNQARCRVTIKKRLSDCFVMGSRLVIILDDLLWVLTDSQLKAALHFIDSLGGLIEKATVLERKTKAARKLDELPEYQAQISQQTRTKSASNTAIAKIFNRYDVIETSYHFLSQRIDLHLCDDMGSGRSLHPELKDGGALQISLVKFQIDYYPYHLALADRKHWALYKESATPHSQWLQQSLNSFRGQFMDLIDSGRTQHSPSIKTQGNMSGNDKDGENRDKALNNQNQNSTSQDPKKSAVHPSGNPVKNYVLEQLAKLMTTCIVIRVDDFTLYKVTTSSRKAMPKEFITAQARKKHGPGDRDRFCLPEDVNILHAEFTYYYYPGDLNFPLPPPKFYVQLNPIQINFDVCSCLWFNSFLLNLYYSLMNNNANMASSSSKFMYFDVKIEAILPRLIFESQQDYINQKDRPKSLHMQTSRATITNVRSSEVSSRDDLAQCLHAFQMGQMFYGSEFPNKSGDFNAVSEKFLEHCAGTDNIRSVPPNFTSNTVSEMIRQLKRELLWTEAKDVWCCNLEPVWGDFLGARAVGQNRPVPFLDAFPLTVWLHMANPGTIIKPGTANIHGLAYISNLISVQINHYQYLFLLRLSEMISELVTYLSIDSNKILKVESGGSMVIGALAPQVEVTFIMPSQTPGKENSGGDLESVVPDTSSIIDDIGGSTTLWQHAVTARVDYSNKRMNTSNDIETPQSEMSSMLSFDFAGGHVNNTATISQTVVTFKQQNGSEKEELKSVGEMSAVEPGPWLKNIQTEKIKLAKADSISGIIPNNFNVNLSSMKKGFSNFMTSLDSALKPSPEDGSDTVSMQSDVSSDSENYIVVSLEDQEKIDAAFNVDNSIRITTVEEASEVVEETPDTQSEKSLDSMCKRKDLVSMTTFKLSKVEIVQQSSGFSSAIKVQVCNFANDECSSIPWDEFQTKFSSRSRGWVELPSDSDCHSRIKLRLDHDLKNKDDAKRIWETSQQAMSDCTGSRSSHNQSIINFYDKDAILGLFEDNIDVKVADVSVTMSISFITGLADLIEDEVIPKPIPTKILLENITVRLNEDRPPNNITSPGPIPIDLDISKLRITRDTSGVFHIEPAVSNSLRNNKEWNSNATEGSYGHLSKLGDQEMEFNALKDINHKLKSDNDELRRRLSMIERLSTENSKLRKVKEELQSSLNDAQEDISVLIKEKRILQESVIDLQNQLPGGALGVSSRGFAWPNKR